MSNILEQRDIYKPFEYPWAFELYKQHEKMHWLPEDVPLADDIKDWQRKLSVEQKNFLTNIFRFFTQGDIDVSAAYINNYMPVFQKPELRMMLCSFAAREAVHIDAYALLIDTLGLPESEYSEFLKYKAMADKHNYIQDFSNETVKDLAKSIAVYSAFTEGLQLFSSFAMLLNFQRFGLMKGMCTIVEWSIKDETVHVEGMIKVFRQLIEENNKIWTDDFKKNIYKIARKMVGLEDGFIDLAFENGWCEGLNKDDMHLFIRHICDRRLLQLGLKANYGIKDNPLPWFEELINTPVFTNIFENAVTEYSKGGLIGDFDTLEYPKF